MSRRDTEHYSQFLAPVAKVALRSPVEFLQSLDEHVWHPFFHNLAFYFPLTPTTTNY